MKISLVVLLSKRWLFNSSSKLKNCAIGVTSSPKGTLFDRLIMIKKQIN